MKFPHMVKHNGVYYPAGKDVPIESNGGEGEKKAPAPVDSGKVEAKMPKASKYSEEDLNLPYMKLKKLAKEKGLKVDNTAKANDIKEMLRKL